jgi:hypothetical protein
MTATPTSPKKHPGGAPVKPGKRYLISIRCTEDEYRRILEQTTAESRTDVLLLWAEVLPPGQILTIESDGKE